MAGSTFQTNAFDLDKLLDDCQRGVLQLPDFQRHIRAKQITHDSRICCYSSNTRKSRRDGHSQKENGSMYTSIMASSKRASTSLFIPFPRERDH